MRKITNLISSIQQNELTKFEEYLHSPYFNKSKLAVRFFSFIRENPDSFKNGRYNKEDLYKKIYPGEKYNEEKLRKITSNFIKLIQRFLIAREADKDFRNEGFLLLKAYSRRNISKSFESSFKMLRDSESGMAKDMNYYFYNINIEDENLNHNFHKTNKDLSRSVSSILNNVNYFFIASKLKYTINTLVLSLLIDNSISYDIWLKKQIMEFISENEDYFSREHNEIYIYYLLLLCFLEPENDYIYEKLMKYFKENVKFLKKDSLESTYTQILCYNFWKKTTNKEKSKELIRIISEIENEGILKEAELIHHHIFINIILELLHNNDKEFAVRFYKNYRSKIAINYRQMTSNLAEAYIAFYNKKIDKCLSLLQDIRYDDFFYYLLTKSLYIQIFYETKKYKMIEALIDSMRQYLKRNAYIPKYYRAEYEIFLKTINTLLQVAVRHNPNKMNSLKRTLNDEIFIPRRNWFLQKVSSIQPHNVLKAKPKKPDPIS